MQDAKSATSVKTSLKTSTTHRNLNESYKVNDVKGGLAARGIVEDIDWADPLRRLEWGKGLKFIENQHQSSIESASMLSDMMTERRTIGRVAM